MPEFKPFVPSEQVVREFTPKAVILGTILGIIFGASTVYLALRAGITVSASIPIAVLSIAVLKKFGRSTILENNIVQTVGSAGESVAAGVVFTIPALYFLAGGQAYFQYFQILVVALVGGIIGVLFMIPLRQALIVKEHGTLPYPEGTACADVLIAGEKGGNLAKLVFSGLGVAFLYKLLMNVFGLWKEVVSYSTSKLSQLPNATLMTEVTPEYLGVGYIIGPSTSAKIVAGGILSWLALIPLITIFGSNLPSVLLPGAKLIAEMTPREIHAGYIKYIGAGAIAAAGLFTLVRTLPTIIAAFRDSMKSILQGSKGGHQRIEHDIPIFYVVVGAILIALIISLLPQLPGTFPSSLLVSALIVVFGFFFVTVSSRIVGIIGSSSNPVSGMTIATLMLTCVIFVAIGWTGAEHQAVAMLVGSIVCMAAANAGATSQDLKTGYIVGATPYKQQIGILIGVVTSAVVVGATLLLLHNSPFGPIGSDKLAAPQATLMATIVKGLLSQELPWGLVIAGAFISLFSEFCGVRSLVIAIGIYLPISTTFAIFVGGMVNAFVGLISRKHDESEMSPGMLYATGLVAGGCVAGVAVAILAGVKNGEYLTYLNLGAKYNLIAGLGPYADIVPVIAFVLLALTLIKKAMKKTVI